MVLKFLLHKLKVSVQKVYSIMFVLTRFHNI